MTEATAVPAAPARAPRTQDGSPTTLRRIARMLAPYRNKMLLVGLAVVVAGAARHLAPFLTKAVFDDALFPTDGRPADLHLLGWLVAGLCVIPIATALIGIGQNLLTSTIGNSAMADLRSDLFAHLQKMELAFFTATKTGAIQSRLANDVSGVRTVLTDTATTILQNSVTVISAFIAMVMLQLAADAHHARADAAVRLDAAAGGPAPAAAGPAHAGVAVGDDGDHRGVALGLGHPAGQGVQPGRLRGRSATARRTRGRPGCRSSRP